MTDRSREKKKKRERNGDSEIWVCNPIMWLLFGFEHKAFIAWNAFAFYKKDLRGS